ncbi:MAG: MarR family winged helix-turn-helix transcriptional regulator [Alphaproteobacteria bacterium]|nr:MarR family winged helix-turn-helix transcriptional regulator [Alphaproteobacteria bacterium]
MLEDQIGHLLRRAHQRASAIFMDRIGNARLTPTQYAALVKIQDEGEVSQNQLGRLTAMDPATIKGVVERLCARDLVASHRDPTNQRRLILTLTAAGQRVVDQAIPRGREITDSTLAPLSAGEQRRLIALLKRLA